MAFSGKYGYITVENDSPNHPLNDSEEPVFVLRAQDVTSLHTLKYYQQGLDDEQSAGLEEVIQRFLEWQSMHLIKAPD